MFCLHDIATECAHNITLICNTFMCLIGAFKSTEESFVQDS